MPELTSQDIEWEKIENPDPYGPYWQPVNPYARYFWRELVDLVRAHKRDTEYSQEVSKKLASYFRGR